MTIADCLRYHQTGGLATRGVRNPRVIIWLPSTAACHSPNVASPPRLLFHRSQAQRMQMGPSGVEQRGDKGRSLSASVGESSLTRPNLRWGGRDENVNPRLISHPEPGRLPVRLSCRCPSGIRMRACPGRSHVHTYSGKIMAVRSKSEIPETQKGSVSTGNVNWIFYL